MNGTAMFLCQASLNNNNKLYTRTSLRKLAALMCLCIYLPKDGLIEGETGRRNISTYYLLLIVQFVVSDTV
jgi:hypothetical protein